MILDKGTKVLLAHRRLFPGDHGRFFVGTVEAYDGGVARVDGHTWMRDVYDGTFQKKEDSRVKIVSIASGTVIVYQIPSTVDLNSFRIELDHSRAVARDDRGWEMDLNEGALFGAAAALPTPTLTSTPEPVM